MHGRHLWRFHAVHHSSQNVDWLSAVRLHPVNEIGAKLMQLVPLYLLGRGPRRVGDDRELPLVPCGPNLRSRWACRMRTFFKSTSSSSATRIGSDVRTPCPISDFETHTVTRPSVPTCTNVPRSNGRCLGSPDRQDQLSVVHEQAGGDAHLQDRAIFTVSARQIHSLQVGEQRRFDGVVGNLANKGLGRIELVERDSRDLPRRMTLSSCHFVAITVTFWFRKIPRTDAPSLSSSLIERTRDKAKRLPYRSLLRRLRDEAQAWGLEVGRPHRRRRTQLVKKDPLQTAVRVAVLREDCVGIIIIFDADDDCPKELAPTIEDWAREAARGKACAVVMANREYEAWFLASIEALRGRAAILPDATSHLHPESPRDAKGELERRMASGASYSPTVDQAALTAHLNLESAYRHCRSFRKLVGAFGVLASAAGDRCSNRRNCFGPSMTSNAIPFASRLPIL